MSDHPPVYTPSTLAERWQCSERHVRNMIADGKLQAFRLGGKLLRIRPSEVAQIEAIGITQVPRVVDGSAGEHEPPVKRPRAKRLDIGWRAS